MKKYEAIFILDDQKVDDAGGAFVKQAESVIVELGGTLDKTEGMGQRQMVHSIRKRNTGIYWSIVADLPEEKVAAFKERYRLDEAVLRLEMFIYDRPEKISLNNHVRERHDDDDDMPHRR